MQALSFMFWVLQTAVKMICFELMHTVPVHSGTFKWIGVRDSIKKSVCNRMSDVKIYVVANIPGNSNESRNFVNIQSNLSTFLDVLNR